MYCSPNIARVTKDIKLRRPRRVARIEEGRNAFKLLTRKRILGRPRRRWENNIRMDLK